MIQNNQLPKHTLQVIKLINYQFVWGRQREVAWKKMTPPKGERELGMKDYKEIEMATIINKMGKIWKGGEIWVN